MKPEPDEAQIAEILADLYDADPAESRDALETAIAKHPELADDLRAHAVMLDLVSEAFGDAHTANTGLPAEIGGYQVVDVLGRGGMATVYRALQHEPIRREVAVKVLDRRLHGAQALARFEVERESLSRMNHPHIARVLDAGFTEGSRPFVVMELVEGEPISDIASGSVSRSRPDWRSLSTCATRCSTPIRRASSTGTSSRRTCSSPRSTAKHTQR